MLRALFLTMILVAATPAAAAADTAPDPGANAALKYWQAFATLPKLSDADSRRLDDDGPEKPMGQKEQQILADAENSLTMLRRGSALSRCDWGIGSEDGISLRTPHIPASFTLSSIACLRARVRFKEGRNAEAIDDLMAVMALGRHLSAAGVSHDVLAGYEVEHRAIDTLARDLPRIRPSDLKALKARLEALPAGARPALAMRGEERLLLDWFVRSVAGAKDRQALLAFVTFVDQACSIPDRPKDPAARGRAFLDACGGDARSVLRRAEEIRPLYATLTTRLDLPFDQFAVWWKAEEARHAGNPVMTAFFGRIMRIRFQQARIEVRRAYLAAALDVSLAGRKALVRHKDPVVSEPIEYVPFPGGFELRSKLKWDAGAPRVAVVVGRRTDGQLRTQARDSTAETAGSAR